MPNITLLDGSLKLTIFFDELESHFEDNLCFRFEEDCPVDEKLFKSDETNIYLTPEQVGLIALELNRAMDAYRRYFGSGDSGREI